jgi:hypothetical protein
VDIAKLFEEAAAQAAEQNAMYTFADGTKEMVRVVKAHGDGDGGGYTIFIGSLQRERQTVEERLEFSRGGARAWSWSQEQQLQLPSMDTARLAPVLEVCLSPTQKKKRSKRRVEARGAQPVKGTRSTRHITKEDRRASDEVPDAQMNCNALLAEAILSGPPAD